MSADDLDDEIVQEFLIESHENLDQLDRDLVALEQSPGSRELLASIFRTIHTIKGTSGFLAFGKLESITHVGENLLAKLRDGVFTMTPEIATALLRMVDLVRELLANIEQSGAEGDVDVQQLADQLRELLEAKVAEASAAAAAPAPAAAPELLPAATVEPVVEPVAAEAPEPAVQPVAPAAAAQPAPVTSAAAVPVRPAATAEVSEVEPRTAIGDSTIRVDVTLLEHLVRLAGELVLARNQILQRSSLVPDEDLARACHQLSLVTGELQEGVMRTRMQPIDHVWAKLPRVVRDLGAQLGRSVRLEMEGGDTELDRTLLEAVKDPLTHLVRNAIDHGIEPAEVRLAAGKPATGLLRLRAAHESGQVLLEVIDDGKGLDGQTLAAKAIEKGLVSAGRVENMSSQELLQLVFIPGFSTAAAVTNVSGRGVGMDVVRTNVERIGGSIDVESVPGQGTCWRLRIPLTLAIVPALTVESCGQRFAIPQINLLELVSLDTDRASAGIERVGGAQVLRLRGSLLPLVRLDDALGLADREAGGEGRNSVVAVLEGTGRRFGLVVDRVLDTEEIVVKPLSRALKDIGLYAGATILGDGAVSLILDVASLARQQLHGDVHDDAQSIAAAQHGSSGTERQLLVVSVGEDRRVAMPLEVVTRLEQFPVADLERVGRRDVVRYRGEILPVVRLSDHLSEASSNVQDTVPGVVYTARGRSVALVVNDIVDIVAERSATFSDVEDYGLVGSALIHDKVTEMLDVRAAILAADPLYFEDEDGHEPRQGSEPGARAGYQTQGAS
ncbi:MAG TPA: chemotaxis protein CheA [Jatrophihabitans sp.]|nr:chemotaxis protein CheA [Jatrophihabitans sp.]